MHKEYNLCFIFQKLYSTVSQVFSTPPNHPYKIELFKEERLVFKVQLPLKLESSSQELNLDDCYEVLKIKERDLLRNPTGEIRLLKTNYNTHQLIGSYGFAFTNHIHPYQSNNRKSIQLSIEIASNYTLDYEVIVESNPLALEQLRKEHLYAKKLSFVERADSEKADFLPEELITRPRRQSFKTIQLFDASQSVTLKTRFWSPEKERMKHSFSSQLQRVKTDGIKVQIEPKSKEKNPSGSTGSMKLKFKRVGSQCSLESEKQGFPMMKQSTMDDWETQSFSYQNSLEEEHLYQVIKTNSKIIIPQQSSPSKAMTAVDFNDSQDQANLSLGIQKTGSSSFGLKILLLIAILLLTGLGINVMSKSIKREIRRHKIKV